MKLHSPGTRIGRYRITGVLGHGGFGAVYEAEVLALAGSHGGLPPGQRVALKETFDPDNLNHFQREFMVLKRLDHPNLPCYYELFEENGKGYLVMELIPGQNLDDVLQRKQGGLLESQVLGYALQICDALYYLHHQEPRILHRDIKPANIRITPEGLIKLVDFGLLKEGTGATYSSLRGAGTPAYAPLEQYGVGGSTDPASDIYSLAATLYHLLTGETPIDALTRTTTIPDPLSNPRRYNPRISPHVANAIMRAMAIKQGDRYHAIDAFKGALLYRETTGNKRRSPAPAVAQAIPRADTRARPAATRSAVAPSGNRFGAYMVGAVLLVVALIVLSTSLSTTNNRAANSSLGQSFAGGSTAVVDTPKGTFKIHLFTDDPSVKGTVKNFQDKAASGYFDGKIFHRVEDWVIQGGDPKGDGTGGGSMPGEYNQRAFKRGAVGMASTAGAGPTVNDSQWFVVKKDADYLNGQYSNFGQVTDGMDVVDKIAIGDKMTKITMQP